MTQTTAEPIPSAKPAPFPHRYQVAVEASAPSPAVMTAGPRPSILGGPPPEFLGKDDWWSPEHLLLSAVGLCLETTFQVFAAKEGLVVPRYSSLVTGTLEKTSAGIVFTAVAVHVELTVAAAAFETAERLLQSAKKYCIVSNSLKTPVDLRVSLAAA